LIHYERVAEVVRILTSLPPGLDSLDTVELMMELEEEFGAETVKLAVRFTEVMSVKPDPPLSDDPHSTTRNLVAMVISPTDGSTGNAIILLGDALSDGGPPLQLGAKVVYRTEAAVPQVAVSPQGNVALPAVGALQVLRPLCGETCGPTIGGAT
jgi:hypothetical protein